MSVLSAQTIRKLCIRSEEYSRPMIDPFKERTVIRGKSFGLSTAGYDVRVEFATGSMWKFSTPRIVGGILFPGHTFMLASTVERFCMPTHIRGVVHDKSTWVRKGLTVQNTVIEPGWSGYLTLELIYHGKEDLVVRAGDPIAQIAFEYLDLPTDQPYTGKYQHQERGPQAARDEQ